MSRPRRWAVIRVVTRIPALGSLGGPGGPTGSDDVAPDGQQRAEERGHQTVTEQQQAALPGSEQLGPWKVAVIASRAPPGIHL